MQWVGFAQGDPLKMVQPTQAFHMLMVILTMVLE
ncbi:hypothetical protein CsSME_00015320 [Camellia sinensis var. sinensis]